MVIFKSNLFVIFLYSLIMKLCSFNVNGLRNVNKRAQIMTLLKHDKYDIVLLQETFADIELIEEMKKQWQGDIYFSNAGILRRGVAIMVGPSWKSKVKFCRRDEEGRLLHVSVICDDVKYNLLNIYAPNQVAERKLFFLTN